MLKSLRRKISRWYAKKGFGFYNDPHTGFSYHICPWYVRPFLFLFSSSYFYLERIGETLAEGFSEGIRIQTEFILSGTKEKGVMNDMSDYIDGREVEKR